MKEASNNLYLMFIAIVVSLGGFLFGFDAGIISGVMDYAGPQMGLDEIQWGWVVSSPSFAAMFAMLISGKISDIIGRKTVLIGVAFLYAISALLSAYAGSYEMLYIARMVGGVAFGAALILAPMYIAEISTAKNRGRLVSIQQLNIVLGFFAAFVCNNVLNGMNGTEGSFFTDETVWRWMLGIELIPAVLYFIFLFFVPRSPRWLYANGKQEEARGVMTKLYGAEAAEVESANIEKAIREQKGTEKLAIKELFNPAIRFILIVGLLLGILQQATGINAIYFYATTIFKMTGIGTDAAFTSGVLLSFTSVVFTIIGMFLIDRLGRRPLLLVGIGGIAVSMLLCAFGFSQATYKLSADAISKLNVPAVYQPKLKQQIGKEYTDDVSFKNAMKAVFKKEDGSQKTDYGKYEGAILEAAISMNPILVFIGILGFIACFAFSLGPVMWVMLSEMYPIKYKGLAIGFIGFINSATSTLVQYIFPWELSNIGTTLTFMIFGLFALVGFFIFLKVLPETKGKSLEQLEKELVKS